jgi:uncharacterized RDD family membrane protein YckC/ribosomal protein L40E
MQCPNCNAAVPEGASICTQCGTRLQEVCPNCGAVRPPGARYCRSCGAYLEGSLDAPTAPSEEPRCPRCHSINEPTAAFCYSCGLPFDEQPRPYGANILRAGRPAGFWIRVVAALIDGLFLALTSLLLSALWPGTTVAEAVTSENLWTTVDSVSVIVAVLYYTLTVSIWSTTIGKRIVGIYVLRPNGSRVGVGRAFARYLAGNLSALLFFAGYLMVAFRSDKRGLHDLICDTVVVYRR